MAGLQKRTEKLRHVSYIRIAETAGIKSLAPRPRMVVVHPPDHPPGPELRRMNAVSQESLEVATPGNANVRESRVHGAMILDDPASSTYFDVLVGHVFMREGHRLTVRGATLIRQD